MDDYTYLRIYPFVGLLNNNGHCGAKLQGSTVNSNTIIYYEGTYHVMDAAGNLQCLRWNRMFVLRAHVRALR